MNIIKIKKLNITSNEFDEEKNTWEEIDITKLEYPFTRYFGQPVEVDKDVTVEDLMIHIKKHSELINLCFYSYLDGESIIPYCDLALSEPDEKHFIDTIEFFWANELLENEYYLFGTFHGIITKEENFNQIEASRVNSFALDLTLINNWKHCNIFINDGMRASTIDDNEKGQVMQLRNRWTLFQLLKYFLSDLTCYGSLEDLIKEKEDFEKEKNRYDGFRKDPEFATKLRQDELVIFITEVKSQLEAVNEDLKLALEEEDFESAAEFNLSLIHI